MPTRSLQPYTRQPMHHLIRERKLTYPAVAHAIGLVTKDDTQGDQDKKIQSLRNVGYGRIFPSAHMLRELPRFFGVPIEQLFDAKVLRGSTHHVGRKRREGGEAACTTPSTRS